VIFPFDRTWATCGQLWSPSPLRSPFWHFSQIAPPTPPLLCFCSNLVPFTVGVGRHPISFVLVGTSVPYFPHLGCVAPGAELSTSLVSVLAVYIVSVFFAGPIPYFPFRLVSCATVFPLQNFLFLQLKHSFLSLFGLSFSYASRLSVYCPASFFFFFSVLKIIGLFSLFLRTRLPDLNSLCFLLDWPFPPSILPPLHRWPL